MISFLALDPQPLPALPQDTVRRWVEAVAKAHQRQAGDITYIFVTEERMLQANRQFLGHDYYTDVLTFDYTEPPFLSADILIAPDTVRSNALALGVPYAQELMRVVIHGVLHLCGIADKEPAQRLAMQAEEDQALALLHTFTQPQRACHSSLPSSSWLAAPQPTTSSQWCSSSTRATRCATSP